MTRYVIGRLFESVLVLALMSFVIYALIALMPGDPIDIMVQSNPDLTPEDATRLKALYGLDKPIFERYWNWLTAAAERDFGYSRIHGRPVLEVMGPRLANTGLLMGLALVLSLAIALPVGIYSALRPYSASDYAINFLALAGISVPVFWLALMLIVIFAVTLNWLPAGGMETIGSEAQGFSWILDRARYLVLPVIALSVASIGGLTRYVRAAMMEIMRQDYIRTARAKGLVDRTVLWRHALRNAMLPVVTMTGLMLAGILSGMVAVERALGIPGIGFTLINAMDRGDWMMIQNLVLFFGVIYVFLNLAVDLTYAWIDPRIRYQ